MKSKPLTARPLPERRTCLRCGMKFAFTNLAVAIAMILLKVIVGIIAGSQALMASALYSVNDLLAAIAVIASLKLGAKPPDAEHPFGHGKVEFVAIGVISLVLAASVVMAAHSAIDLVTGTEGPPEAAALAVAVLSIGASMLLAQKALCVAVRLNSPSMHTSADHNHADAISSCAVAVGLIGAMLGLHWLDRVVAIYETFDVMRLSGKLLGRSLRGLMDTALPQEQVDALREACESTEGVSRVDTIRTRSSGQEIWVDVLVVVDADLSVQRAHGITRRVGEVIQKSLGPTVKSQVAFRSGTRLIQANAVSGHAQ